MFVSSALVEYFSIIAMLRFPINHNVEDPADALTNEQKIYKKRLSAAVLIDMCSMVLFIVLFALFNITYFVTVDGN